jgi:hypothetical protein
LLIRDHWWAYVCGGDTSIRVRTPDFTQDYSVRWCARWLERAYGTPNPSGGLYLLGTTYSDSNAVFGISTTGEVIWSQTVAVENADFRDISAVPDSGCVVAGTLLSSTNGDRALLIRLGTRGEVLWTGEYGTFADEFITDAVFSTRSGGFVLAGQIAQGDTIYPYIIRTRPDSADLTVDPPSPPPGALLDYTLSAFPNPFNANTTLYFATSRTENVRIDVYDLVGRFVKTAVNQEYAPGGWRVPFDAAGLPSGIYFARINIAAGFTATQKLLLLR